MPSGFYLPDSSVEPIVGIQICIFSPDEVERRSVVEITNAGTFEGNEPKIGGLFDPRMGVLDSGKECRSCGQTNHKCPGHFGHFRLARPVYYIQFLPFILNILSCVCIRCSKLLVDKQFRANFLKRRGEARWREVLMASKEIRRCGQETEDGCGARKPNRFVREGIARIVAEWDENDAVSPTKQKQPLEVEYVLRLFRRITDEDVDFMGLSRYWCRPDWMICTVLAIPPPQVRPSVITDNNQRSEDDLTHKLAEIIKTNNTYLQPRIDANAAKSVIDEWTNVLQYHVATLVDNQIPGVAPSAQRNGRPLKSIQQRLGSKEGRIRYNIQGKRVEFSARSVITPDPNISITELGVPEKIAMNLTRPERVTIYNRDKLYKFIQNGPLKFPGAKTIRRPDGRIISLRHVNTKEIVLHIGDVVNRHLMDGDVVLFNRQPTLHRMSMMGHRVKVLPFKTFRLNVSVTAPYNADFDGDEMNMHCPQSYEAATELEEIAAVPHQILRPRDGLPVIGIVQDTLVGSYRLTRDHVSFNRREFMNLTMWNKRFDGKVPQPKNPARWSGHQVISQLLPPIHMDMPNSSKKKVIIRDGQVLEGQIDKAIFSKASRGIIHMTYNDYGSKQTTDLIDSLQNTIEQFLVYNGFSVGISDLIADQTTKEEMDKKIQARKTEIEALLLQIHQDLFDNNTGKSNRDELEDKVFGILNKATELAGEIGQASLATENRMTAMVRAGSKGGPINIAQMIACVGQQNIEGKRIPYGFEDRTLPHFKKYDDGAEARGFIENSFIGGLTPTEFFFHAMSGREGLIDTAVKTADTGYIQRQLVKAMEDLVVQNDGTVRDANMNILQFHYGEDGINSTKIESQGLALGGLSNEEIDRDFGLVGVDISSILEEGIGAAAGRDPAAEAAALVAFSEQVKVDRKMLVEGIFRSGAQGNVYAAVNFERLLVTVRMKFALDVTKRTSLTPTRVLAGIEAVLAKTQRYHKMWAALLRFHLAPGKIIQRDRFTESAFDTLCEMLVTKNWQAWAQPGEQVGVIAAQSIGEPSTQMSQPFESLVHIITRSTNTHFIGKIGVFVDGLMAANPTKVVPHGTDSSLLDTSDYLIASVSKDEKTSWSPISQVTRHPANGGMVKVTTKSGRTTTATLSHSFLKRSREGIVPILGSDLRVGMRIPIAKRVPKVTMGPTQVVVGNTTFPLTKDFGWLCGLYLADGSFSGNIVKISKVNPIVEVILSTLADYYGWEFSTREYQGQYGPSKDNNLYSKDLKDFLLTHFSTGSYQKKIAGAVYSYPTEFIAGLLGGYFDGDGNVNVERQQIRVGSRSEELIRDINRLFGYAGFFTVMGSETSVRIPGKVMWTLNVLKNDARRFKEEIGLKLPEKAAALEQIITYTEREEKHDTKELYDKIPELGDLIAETGKLLKMPGQSRTYGRWTKKESVGRTTLQAYVSDFNEMFAIVKNTLSSTVYDTVVANLALLDSAARADVVWDEIVDLTYLDDPKEYVYDFTVPGNESFMVDDCVLVHNTLNSVDWDTRILIAKDGRIQQPEIGQFVDDYYTDLKNKAANGDEMAAARIQHLPNDQIYIELEDGHDWQAVSCGEDGIVKWTKLEAITRHPVINEDGSDTILEVETESGRTVKATKALSFLTRSVDDKVVSIKGSDLKIGSVLPIVNKLALNQLPTLTEFSLREVLPPTEWLYGTDAATALATMRAADAAGKRHWFGTTNGLLFTVPYNRSDSFREAFANGHNTNADVIRPGFVYTKKMMKGVSQIPESIPLTQDFGYFVGAYLAEGMSNTTQINITNNDQEFFDPIKRVLAEWEIGHHTVCEERDCEKTGIKGTTTSLVIHSTLLAQVFKTLFGRLSYDKTVPDWILQAPDEFVKGLVDAYVCGDGTICKRSGCIIVGSVSRDLLVRFSTLLARYEIFSKISEHMPDLGKFNSVKMQYTLSLTVSQSAKFAKSFTLSMERKQQILDYHFNLMEKDAPLRNDTTADMIWDPIKNIKEVSPIKKWVYDLTVEETRNFVTYSGQALRDTFHLAGVSSKSNVTRGVPRLKELLKVMKNPKAKSLTIHLKPEYSDSKVKAREVAQELGLTLLRDMTTKVAIYFDPKDSNTVLKEDRELLAFYKLFEEPEPVVEAQAGASQEPWSKWLLRLELDRQRMFDKNITMDDILFVLRRRFDDDIHAVYSDFNSQKLVMRIRLPAEKPSDKPAKTDPGSLDDLSSYKKFQSKLLNAVIIRGVPGIKAVTFRKGSERFVFDATEGKYKTKEEYILDTDGSNFQEVINHPAVDATRVFSTHCYDIYAQLGVEATRQILFNEIQTLFEEGQINYRHLGLLVDVMTRAGRMMSVDRYGINKNDIGPLAKASFEETEGILLKAAVFGEIDPVTGVSANIMMGQPIRGGTAFSDILLDEAALLRLQKGLPAVESAEEEAEPTQEDVDAELFHDKDDMCSPSRLRMNMTLPKASTVYEDEEDVDVVVLEA